MRLRSTKLFQLFTDLSGHNIDLKKLDLLIRTKCGNKASFTWNYSLIITYAMDPFVKNWLKQLLKAIHLEHVILLQLL